MSITTVAKNRIINPTKTLCVEVKNKQIKLGVTRWFASVLRGTSLSGRLSKKIHRIIIDQIENEFGYVLEKYNSYACECHYDENAPVWVCWLQGLENAPDIVKKCVQSIKNSTNHPVNFLCFDNIFDYNVLPDYIIEKHKKSMISNTELADILRVSLLAEYGGIWIDATIFVPNALPEKMFEYDFFTCKRNIDNCSYVSDYKWTTFLIGSKKNGLIVSLVRDLFFEYWKKKDYLIDYLLFDYFIKVVYENNDIARKIIDELPYNNPQIEELQNRMNNEFNKKEYENLLNNSNTDLFKLSWRMNFNKATKDGKETYFGHFIDN